jgi:hypothetical protein
MPRGLSFGQHRRSPPEVGMNAWHYTMIVLVNPRIESEPGRRA